MPNPTNDARLELRLPEKLKDELMETGNANAYLRESARRRLRRYHQAREQLSDWTQNELRAVMAVLSGTRVDPTVDLGEQIAASMEDAERLDSTATAWGISSERWANLCKLVREQEPIARAVRRVAGEYWSDPSDHVDL